MPEAKSHLKYLIRIAPPLASRGRYLRLDMNENASGLPEGLIAAAKKKLTPSFLSTYPETGSLQEKIALVNGLKAENICVTSGSDSAIKYIFDAYVSAGDSVLFAVPTFAMYSVYCKMNNAVELTLSYKDDLSFPEESFLEKIAPGIKLAIIVNPNNPTGSAIKPQALNRILLKARESNILLIVDEAYYYFYPYTAIAQVKEFDNLIVLRTFSKLCGMAALRVGYAAASENITENLKRVRPTFDTNAFGIMLAGKVMDNPQIIRSLIEKINHGKRYLSGMLIKNGIPHVEGEGNFILIKCPGMVSVVMEGLKNDGILVSGGFNHDFLKDFIRVTTGDKAQMIRFWLSFIKICRDRNLYA